MKKYFLSICIITLFIFTGLTPMTVGDNKAIQSENIVYDEFDLYNNSWYISDGKFNKQDNTNIGIRLSNNNGLCKSVNEKSSTSSSSPMDSPWPMLSHDIHHTGLSPYSTANNLGVEKWRFRSDRNGAIESSAVIDNNGTIYFGNMGSSNALYAVNPNGTKKWKIGIGSIWSTPVIDENGVIYIGNLMIGPTYLYAIYTKNGTLKWKYPIGGTFSSPVVSIDGTIIFGDGNSRIIALYPDGTLKWTYKTGDFVASSAAIGDDGIIYIGSSDGYLYALYPNGTLNWRFGTGGWIKGHPTIDNDGTIYVPSFDGNLYALYPNGTLKWSIDYGGSVASAGAVIGPDETLYVGTDMLRAFYPVDGSLKWSCDIGGELYGTVPAVSSDGTIFVSADNYHNGGDIVAVYPDGTVKWRYRIADVAARSSPCIGSDGSVYVGSTWDSSSGWFGYLFSFNNLDPNAPSAPNIDGPLNGKAGKEYKYSFKSTSPLGNDVYYYIDWGDGYWTDWIGPYKSSEITTAVHTWKLDGNYTIRARAKDTDNLWGPWGTLDIKIPRTKIATNILLQRFLDRFPILEKLLKQLDFQY